MGILVSRDEQTQEADCLPDRPNERDQSRLCPSRLRSRAPLRGLARCVLPWPRDPWTQTDTHSRANSPHDRRAKTAGHRSVGEIATAPCGSGKHSQRVLVPPDTLAISYRYEAASSLVGLMAASLVIYVPVPSRSNLIVDTNHRVIGSVDPPESQPGGHTRRQCWSPRCGPASRTRTHLCESRTIRRVFGSVLSQELGAGKVRLQEESPRALEGEGVRQRGGLWIQRGPCHSNACGLRRTSWRWCLL